MMEVITSLPLRPARSGLARVRHACPVAGCRELIPPSSAMCGSHWNLCPQGMKDAIYREYGDGPGSPAHQEAVAIGAEAVRVMCAPRVSSRAEHEAYPAGRWAGGKS